MDDERRAVALRYDRDGDLPPIVAASGQGFLADRIVEIAEANGVPVHRDKPLSELLARMEAGTPIPMIAFSAVAEILARIYRTDRELAERRRGERTS